VAHASPISVKFRGKSSRHKGEEYTERKTFSAMHAYHQARQRHGRLKSRPEFDTLSKLHWHAFSVIVEFFVLTLSVRHRVMAFLYEMSF